MEPTPGVCQPRFFGKSAQAEENNGVEFLASAKKCKNVQESVQGYENKGQKVILAGSGIAEVTEKKEEFAPLAES
jgi:hypothetical protein